MKELGLAEEDYIIRYRHFRLDPEEKREIKGDNHYYFFIYPYYNIRVESKTGLYDMDDDGVNEMQHYHTGLIKLENQSKNRMDAKFIQIVPLEMRRKTLENDE
ncbi:MAG: hypothetical protein MK086_14245 [Flavobacteriales bacterium]|nr:hypothetical protein [Flavobacteriales bacterium]